MKEVPFEAKASSFYQATMMHNSVAGFRIPEYQRRYDWSEGNIIRLYSDCLIGFERLFGGSGGDHPTFLGTIILVREQEKDTREEGFDGVSLAIVDGQQRLTTLALFACALYEDISNAKDGLDMSELKLSPNEKKWIDDESRFRLARLLECFSGNIHDAGEVNPYPRIIRAGEDTRARLPRDEEYNSPLGNFLQEFTKHAVGRKRGDFPMPEASAGTLYNNYENIKQLVGNINDASWYEDMEFKQVPTFDEKTRVDTTTCLCDWECILQMNPNRGKPFPTCRNAAPYMVSSGPCCSRRIFATTLY